MAARSNARSRLSDRPSAARAAGSNSGAARPREIAISCRRLYSTSSGVACCCCGAAVVLLLRRHLPSCCCGAAAVVVLPCCCGACASKLVALLVPPSRTSHFAVEPPYVVVPEIELISTCVDMLLICCCCRRCCSLYVARGYECACCCRCAGDRADQILTRGNSFVGATWQQFGRGLLSLCARHSAASAHPGSSSTGGAPKVRTWRTRTTLTLAHSVSTWHAGAS